MTFRIAVSGHFAPALVGLLALAGTVWAQTDDGFATDRLPVQPAAAAAPSPETPTTLSMAAALRFALENNPTLAAQRRQRGIAAARVVIADTYPFNPTLETRVQRATGPADAAVTNNYPVESLLLWEVEIRGQRRIRREGAMAALSRTEWEIAAAEQSVAAQVIKAYATLQFRRERMQLLEETLKLNEQLVKDVVRLVDANKLHQADLIRARTEVSATLDLVSVGREAETAARQDLLRALGLVDGAIDLGDPFEPAAWSPDPNVLAELATTRRADLQARKLAVTEAAANSRLATANRYGNPIVGAVYTYDPTKITMIGPQVNIPLPIANTQRGQIFQSEMEHALALDTLRQTEITVRQDVASALARLAVAERRVEQYKSRIFPDLRQAVAEIDKLFLGGDPSVDLTAVFDVRRKLLSARDGYLDALWSVRQARADLAAAVGEPALGLGLPEPPAPPPAKMGVPKK
jgi:cobalt-zinc-cadmium efflux system outer membrane protein